MPAVPVNPRLWISALLLAAALLWPGFAAAQITRTARIELTADSARVPVGQDIYITPAAENHLNEQIIATRHENNLRGTRQESGIINLGLAPRPVWMVFSVTNNSKREGWVLDFGALSSGRTGFAHRLMVRNHTRDQTFVRAMREPAKPGAFGETIEGSAVPVKISAGKTELFVVYLEAEGGLPAVFAPSLMTPQQHMQDTRRGDIPAMLMVLALVVAATFFGAAAYLEKKSFYGLFSVYYIANTVFLVVVQTTFFMAFPMGGDLVSLLFPLCFLIGVAMTYMFLGLTAEDYSDNAVVLSTVSLIAVSALLALLLPSQNSVFDDALMFLPSAGGMLAMAALCFSHAQRGRFAVYFLASGWAVSFASFLIAMPSAAGLFGGNRISLNAYWIFLIPQAFFFATAVAKQIERLHVEERAAIGRESRAAQSLARLKQSKETADQARLLRVIERERELMAELREQEIQRTEEMRRAKEMADQANRAKSAFLAVVSHEIRTPMTGIMGILRLFKDTKLSKEQADYLLTIQKSSDTMMALLNDILDFEKIESGNMEMEEIDFDLPKLVQGVVTLMAGHAADRKNVLVADFPDDFPVFLKGDPNRLRQVLLNLVNNAIKFTQNGSVTIRLRAVRVEKKHPGIKGDYEVYFGVEDTGIGISEKAQEKLFTPFEQADSSVSRQYGGTGLGLEICKKLVAAMGGSIGMTSQIGVGSTFYFSLLMKRGDEAVENVEHVPPVPEHASVKPDLSAPEVLTPNSSGFASRLVSPMEIMVVEDNEINRKVMRNFLEKEGHRVTLAESGEEALEIIVRARFDAVFLDINMGGMNGLETARVIRALSDRVAAATPLIALTGNVAPEDVRSFYNAGISGFIAKPVDYDFLLETLRRIQDGIPLANMSHAEKSVNATVVAKVEEKKKAQEVPILRLAPGRPKMGPGSPDDIAPIHKFLRDEEGRDELETDVASNADAAAMPGLLDINMLDGLRRSLGEEQMRELLNGFIEKTDEIVAALQTSSDAGDTQALYERAHELKGMAANFGMKDLAKIASVVEKAAKEGKISGSVAGLPPAAARTSDAIRSWMS